ncbi:MAG: hypothetical protein Q8P45_01455 [Candidatus Harrisonbacteria bacterium]|nr:hypothetical protein [Candidatus Harrisonbacteria bacterium]
MEEIEIKPQSKESIDRSLAIPDLTDPKNGTHAINLVIQKLEDGFSKAPGWPKPEILRFNPLVSVEDNFDRLRFPKDNIGRGSRYTRYASPDTLLRTHTSAHVPDILKEIGEKGIEDHLVMVPGICYRRDVVDKKHCGEPHQIDIWRTKKGEPRLERADLLQLVDIIVNSIIPGAKYRANEVKHPYTINGLEIEVMFNGNWFELMECGETHPEVLEASGLDPSIYSGLASGMGLDRLVMILKGIDDIRILRSTDPRIVKQMTNLDPYVPVSKYPAVTHDISFSVDKEMSEEDICEDIREAIPDAMDALEEVTILSETPYEKLPEPAKERLGIKPDQKNILARLVIRSHDRTLTQEESNDLRNRIYRAVNQSGTEGYLDPSLTPK